MALNVKAAMLLCAGVISGLCLWVSRVDLPALAAPGSALSQSPFTAQLAGLGSSQDDRSSTARGGASPTFTHGNAFDAQAKANRNTEERLVVAPVPAAMAGSRQVVLPPLAQAAPPEPVIADAPPEPVASPERQPAPTRTVAGTIGEAPAAVDGTPRPPELAQPNADAPAKAVTYKVQKGDSLAKIAQRHFHSADVRLLQLLTAANPKLAQRPNNKVLLGEELIIPEPAVVDRVRHGEKPAVALAPARPAPDKAARPAPSAPAAARSRETNKTAKSSTPTSPAGKKAAGQPASPPQAAKSRETAKPRWYTIRQCDSLKSIAERCLNDGRRWREIAQLNGLPSPDKIVVGQRIKLPDPLAEQRG